MHQVLCECWNVSQGPILWTLFLRNNDNHTYISNNKIKQKYEYWDTNDDSLIFRLIYRLFLLLISFFSQTKLFTFTQIKKLLISRLELLKRIIYFLRIPLNRGYFFLSLFFINITPYMSSASVYLRSILSSILLHRFTLWRISSVKEKTRIRLLPCQWEINYLVKIWEQK